MQKSKTDLSPYLLDILEVARLAPSVHNTQPWKVSTERDRIQIAIDENFSLKDGDPTGRETIISLGIFTEALIIGAESVGLKVVLIDFQDRAVNLTLVKGRKARNSSSKIYLLTRRCTDRSVYQPVKIQPRILNSFRKAWRSQSVRVRTTTDKQTIKIASALTSKGVQLALTSPSFRKELSHYLVRPLSLRKRGISTRSLYISPFLEFFEPWLLNKGIGVGTEISLEKKRWESASGLVMITANGDVQDYWFEAGRAYLQVSLAIEKSGLSQATSAAIVEASDFHEDIEKALGTNQRLLCLIRIGQGSQKKYYSPRVEAKELLAT